jgi:hypothetical protein
MQQVHQHNTLVRQEDAGMAARKESIWKSAVSATIHCLIVCGIGEVVGMMVASYTGMTVTGSLVLSIVMGFFFGFALGILPMVRKGVSVVKSLKIVLVAEGLSIAVMETFEALTESIVPRVMTATLWDGLFCQGTAASLVAGFTAALPVNYYLIKRGIRHHH